MKLKLIMNYESFLKTPENIGMEDAGYFTNMQLPFTTSPGKSSITVSLTSCYKKLLQQQ